MRFRALTLSALLAACAQSEAFGQISPEPAVTAGQAAPSAAQQALADRINSAEVDSAEDASGCRPAVVRAQALLDRLHFSPGVIDGHSGANFRRALSAFQAANALPADGDLNPATLEALVRADPAPAIVAHLIKGEEVAGPFVAAIPKSMAEKAVLPRMSYTSPQEALAERFHMDIDFLRALNPDARFAAGETILAAAPSGPLRSPVAKIVVDKTQSQVRAFGADGALLALYPATIGSDDLPSPSGEMEVRAVALEPNYTDDASRLSYVKGQSVLIIPPGPNNPVGGTWIDLTRETYGIHGTPDPALIGKTSSHGCVRLTNWDAAALAQAVAPGVTVSFQ